MELDSELAALGPLGGFFALHTGVPPRSGLPTLERTYATEESAASDAYADPLDFRVRKVARTLGTPEDRVAASLVHQGLAARLWSVALGAAAVYGRVPDLDPRLLRFDPDGSAPDDLWLGEVRGLSAGSLDAVVREGHLVPLTAALISRHRVSARLLWGNAGAALASSVRMIDRWARTGGRTDVAERARSLAAGLFAHPDLARTIDFATGRRRTCCLYYRLPGGGLCGDCCFDRPPGRR
ncbi:(2Fe-2S)-binding protein [Streptomyces sp. NPDC002513]